jgi:hypothetical protein
MSADFFIRITGLCAVTPNPTNSNGSLIMLPDARMAGHGMEAHLIEAHTPAILVPEENIDLANSRKPTLRFPGAFYGRKKLLLFELDGEDLDLAIDPPPTLPAFTKPGTPGDCPPGGLVPADFDWVLRIGDADAGHTPASAATTRGDYSLAAARLWLAAGKYRTERFALDDGDRKILKWKFKSGSSTLNKPNRAVAEELLVSLETNGSDVELTSSANGRIVVIPNGSNVKEIWVVNMPLVDILSDRRDPTNWRDPDHHYAHFYSLSRLSGTKFIPHPEPEGNDCGRQGFGAGGGPKCPPTYFD